MRLIVAFILLFFSSYSSAYAPVEILPSGSQVSLSVTTSSKTLLSINTDKLFPPASTLKIITALAAKLELGDNFRFETQAQKKGNDIIFRFSGDPTLTYNDLDKLLNTLHNKGLHKIEGNIWLNKGAFSGYERAVGWPWDILGVCYSAPSSAITLDGNCVQASIYTNDDGTTRVHVPKHQPIVVKTNAITVSKEQQKAQQCELELTTSSGNEYLLSGCLVKRNKPLPLKFAVQQTDLYVEDKLRTLLIKNNIAFNGQFLLSNDIEGHVIASHFSAQLSQIIEKMLKHSTNLIADNITKTIGARFYSQPGSFTNGTEAIKQIIFSNTGVDINDAQLADGSGLSRNNRISANDLTQILTYIWHNDQKLNFVNMLATSGETGTLRYRKSMNTPQIKGQLQAKSGSIYGSYNMAGFVLNPNKQPKAVFVQFVTDYFPAKNQTTTNAFPAIFQFEDSFYRDLIKLSEHSEYLQ
ncbi:serine-type D-Ala-D-Ala carboxypeptidase [Vibrio sp. TH_r3]|uniref:serine-type D-Ala-D-Ala carboxypeptidase n=1 Tax=Vibrio sp. TH_r3 TaxID=3082084 RepID=UPI002954E243|nr:serine-type D-Ala-D-Ala carboxypeptidase [Vibrio sp. TH_r3]MDV7106128.1 serine-type D-Ala-D-Ala carboxypeptidase [Vibrio sp. TH_r3]